MAKRSRSKSRPRRSRGEDSPAATISAADAAGDEIVDSETNELLGQKDEPSSSSSAEAVGAAHSEGDDGHGQEEDNGTTKELPKSETMWNNVQSRVISDLLPMMSIVSGSGQTNDALTMLLLSQSNHGQNMEDDNDSNESKKAAARQTLINTSQLLFRYIETLADMEDRLKEGERQRKAKAFLNEDDDENNGQDDNDAEEEAAIEPCTLSGIPSLYTGQTDDNENKNDDNAIAVDAETIWGQADLQNAALMPRLKRIIKKLTKKAAASSGDDNKNGEEGIRILDTSGGDEISEGSAGSGVDEGEEANDMSEGSAASDFDQEEEDDDDDDDDNSESRRIRERMERAMADMSDDDNEDDNDNNEEQSAGLSAEKQRRLQQLAAQAAQEEEEEEEGIDEAREDMRDGFFDLHEMEAFADEEEEMLPDNAYGQELPDAGAVDDDDDDEDEDEGKRGKKKKGKKKKTLPHLRDRMGDDSEEEEEEEDEGFDMDEDDEDEDDPLTKRFTPSNIRRKKYRADDEVEALYGMYDENDQDNMEDDDDSDDEGNVKDASTMTAADLFGKPNKKLIKSYKAKQKKNKNEDNVDATDNKRKMANNNDFDDADLWDNHNFEEDGLDWKEKGDDDNDNDVEDDDSEEEQGNEEDDEEDEDGEEGIMDNTTKLSAHGIQSRKLAEQTSQLERDLMAEKPWRVMGEARGTDRGTDSLLDSTPEFEVAFKPPPILTEEHTTDIEEMIKKRIIDEDWDNVVPRELPDIGLKKGADAPEVSQEKSKLGLGELYEREYLKKTTGFDRSAHEKQTEEDAAKEEMKRLFANLCSQLDALSNYQFAPRPVAEEADVENREERPAIAMEEVLPLHVSGSSGAAPEEVYGGAEGVKKGVLKGESELDQAERKRLRNAKKAARRKARKQKHADERLISKLQPGLGLNNPYEKRKLREELQMARASGRVVDARNSGEQGGAWDDEAAAGKEYRTSTKFFQKMQENVEGMVRGDGGDGDGRAKKKRKGLEAGHTSSVYRL